MTSSLALDVETDREKCGAAVRDLMAAGGPLRVVSPYVSGDLKTLAGVAPERRSDLTLICNLKSGNCNPVVLRQLVRGGATVLSQDHVHAKVYASKTGVAVGSANLSPNGLGSGTVEAMVILRSPADRQRVESWFESLRKVSKNIKTTLLDEKEFEKLLAKWKQKQAAAKVGGSKAKASLYDAIVSNDAILDDYIFVMYSKE